MSFKAYIERHSPVGSQTRRNSVNSTTLSGSIEVPGGAQPRKIIARYPIATIGSRTRRGGQVVRTDGVADDYCVACVGDRVRYPDGSESVITSGAGHASTFANRPIALVGSHIANGDRIVAPAQSIGEIIVVEGEQVPGLLEPGYQPPRLAVPG
jgi:uncharacterized Zn-binding protein involved in type VI secretion